MIFWQQARFIRLTGDRQVLVLVIASLLLPLITQAQEASLEKNQNGFKAVPLEVKLTALNPGTCIDSFVVLELELTNVGNEEITIDKSGLWDSFSFEYTQYDGTPGGGGGYSSYCSNCEREKEEVVLTPKMTYRNSHAYQLQEELFHHAGYYTISLDVPYNLTNALNRHINSNSVRFELYQCKPGLFEEQK